MRILNLLFILFSFLVVVFSILFIVLIVGPSFYSTDHYITIAVLTIPLATAVLGIFTFLKSFNAFRKRKSLFSKKKKVQSFFYIALFIFWIGFVGITSFIALSLFNEKPPIFFPFDDTQAIYTVTKKGGLYFITYDSPSNRNSSYNCSTDINGVSCHTDIQHHVDVMVGKSPLDLETFINKKIKLNGDFAYGNKQCIVNKCIDIGPYAVLDIYTIK